jgi:2,4-dienoyl-CoA reductase-like NADH-dependent reductase (Old Yellow Enzyme family)
MSYRRIASLKSVTEFQAYVQQLGIELPIDSEPGGAGSPLAQSFEVHGHTVGNRFAILPMEGWDGTIDGRPTDFTLRRWKNFGRSGAKLIWGGEAVAVRHDGRANPNQLLIHEGTASSLEDLRRALVSAHEQEFERSDDLLVGLQVTHSGRYARPNQSSLPEPRAATSYPALDHRLSAAKEHRCFTDDELKELIDHFIDAARLAEKVGFHFVDIKHCHGYLGHELLSGMDRPGLFGGSFENRTRFLCEIVSGIRAACTRLQLGVRLSAFDFVPFAPGSDSVGVPQSDAIARYHFGSDATGLGYDLEEPRQFLELLRDLGIRLLCTTAGSPYYNPHIQRPALFPPSDGYLPPEDPLVGVARQVAATAALKAEFPDLFVVGSAYSYLQDWLPHVAQAVIGRNGADAVGLGRMVLSYPELPADVLAGRPLDRKRICRTFSDCTTAPRNGMRSGCYPLDPFYKNLPERDRLLQLKSRSKETGT